MRLKIKEILMPLFTALVILSVSCVGIYSFITMGILAFMVLFILASSVGVGVSMDVSGYNLSMAGNATYSSEPRKHSLLHAFWHSLFLAIGMGLVAALATAFQHLMVKYNFEWVFEWIIDKLWLTWMEPLQFPIWILAIIGVALWIKLYWDKIRGEGEDEHVPNWLKWILNLLRVPTSQIKYVLVAVDMWFLTPLLKTIIDGYSIYGKIFFVVIVFGTVYYCSMLSMKYGRRIMQSKNQKVLAYWMITLVWAEPLITGYFAARATWWSFTGAMENNTMFILLSGICVILLCLGKFTETVEDKWEKAGEAVANEGNLLQSETEEVAGARA